MILDEADLMRKALDWDYCSTCRAASRKQYNADDKTYDHMDITGIPLDGSTLTLEEYQRSEEST